MGTKTKWGYETGLNSVGAYQVSGIPYVSGNIDCLDGARPGGFEIQFPYVTRWVQVANADSSNIVKIAFSVSGMTGSNNYLTLQAPPLNGVYNSDVYEWKVSSIWVSGSNNVEIRAGLTSIAPERPTTDAGTNWSGSVGVG